ncbi:DUF3285 domain-containing protein [[Phormidium] sp. ETS-05]|uniref:DUF3285 domain-containing protein n=1 Tax=[Phormidium] sp. ETS-05 TaxID=222819 RepID=UPI0018EECAAA|nr:DUF3285 domain-containing protein [[Phormidium] sp. ETS-05]
MSQQSPSSPVEPESPLPPAPAPSYVKLAMRNMVRKRGTSLKHFTLSTVGLLALLVGLSYLTR